ncbi:cyclin-dependent kinase inhibitor 3-like [Durio zibethinus]|uniref:Cyclin-dependent kinase inhibitor 3-like n=1 Tax=Durio zibethinus TaxID=66656 RepID=A0A6P5XK43_DURZI|nr:cyclin-dependent kinase inhibitor 3-like [Durio zibethinus]
MGKYMKKSKIAGDIAVMEVSHQSTLGARTRYAKTLALQRLQKTNPSPSPVRLVASTPDVSSLSYLQLRSRRLEKLPSPVSCETKQKRQEKESSCRKEKKNGENKSEACFGKNRETVVGMGICCEAEEASFGENNLDFELRDRSTRESTPCSLMKDSETIATPGSTTRRRSSPSTQPRGWNDVQRFISTTHEIEEFFACAEQQQQQQFIEKYNFDIMNDLPLPGRYEWVQVIP